MSKNVQTAIVAAKKRMKSGYWMNRIPGATTSVKSDDKIDKMFETVKQIIESDSIVTDPINRLIDGEYFETLSDIAKSAYVLEIARLYASLKQRYYETLPIAR